MFNLHLHDAVINNRPISLPCPRLPVTSIDDEKHTYNIESKPSHSINKPSIGLANGDTPFFGEGGGAPAPGPYYKWFADLVSQ